MLRLATTLGTRPSRFERELIGSLGKHDVIMLEKWVLTILELNWNLGAVSRKTR